jgi:hypothetical protein
VEEVRPTDGRSDPEEDIMSVGVPTSTTGTPPTPKEHETMPQYLISVWHDDDYGENDWSDPDIARVGQQVGALNEEMERTGTWVFGAGLQPQSTATVVRAVAGGEVSMTDGPYAETKEQMGGFWVIEAPDLDAALDWAGRCAAACEGPVELRPMQCD